MGKMELDLSSFWVPFTPNRHFKSAPRILASAKDMHFMALAWLPLSNSINLSNQYQRMIVPYSF